MLSSLLMSELLVSELKLEILTGIARREKPWGAAIRL
jgi:hypothetical protein